MTVTDLTPASLVVTGATHEFDGRRVLDQVDLEVPAGRVVGLLGPNGAGKTTLMRIVFGVLDADAGTVRWRGAPATAADRRRWGYMPQERGLYREMRTLDHLVWLARLYGRDPIRELSGGMAQRVQLAAAMVHGPELLVLDEPFAGLDPGAIEFLTDVVNDHVAAGGTLVFSSHQLDLVEHLCESIVMLHDGRVVLSGGVRELKRGSTHRYLRVDASVEPDWVASLSARISSSDATGTRLALDQQASAGDVLDAIRRRTQVQDFGVEAPKLSELFLAATRSSS